MLSLTFPSRRGFFGEIFKLHNSPPSDWVFYFHHQVLASRERVGTLVDTWLSLTSNEKILVAYKVRVLIFTNSDLDQAQLKAQEEERQKREAEEKEAQLERKREEKRLKKMVSSACLVLLCSAVVLCTFPPQNLCPEHSFLTSTIFL